MKKQFDTWLKQYDSKFEMKGDLGWFDSIILELNEHDFIQIGIDEKYFVFTYNGDLKYCSENYRDLYKWSEYIENNY